MTAISVELAPDAIFDPSTLARLAHDLDDRGVALRIARHFVDLLPDRVSRLEEALARTDLERALEVTLTIKVTSAVVGGRHVQRLAEDVEASVRSGDWARAARRSEWLHDATVPLCGALCSYLCQQGLSSDLSSASSPQAGSLQASSPQASSPQGTCSVAVVPPPGVPSR